MKGNDSQTFVRKTQTNLYIMFFFNNIFAHVIYRYYVAAQ